jgi:SAM-dependent methyltransferase
MKVTVVDTFANTAFYKSFNVEAMCDVLRRFGVNLVTADLRCYDIDSMFKPGSVDSIASFDCLYFFHPRALLEKAMIALKPGGKLTLSFSNAVSLLKRVKVVAGRSNVGTFQDYFFNGVHQKYWVKEELEQLAKHLKLREQKIMGRNWSVYQKWKSYPKPFLRAVDQGLRPIPSLCNVLYLVGVK